LAADLVRRQVSVLVANGPAAQAAQAATTKIPVVFYTAADPVAVGLVASLGRPGGNITGVTSLGVQVGPKRLELLHEVVPTAKNIGLLVNPTYRDNAATLSEEVQKAAGALGLQLHILHASSEDDLNKAFARLAELQGRGLVIGPDAFFGYHSKQLADLTVRHSVPAIFQDRDFAARGGLMSYGSSFTDVYRLVGLYVAKVLKGEKPLDMPVQQSVKVELIVNLHTARALGITVPPTLLARADEVIE
jgi:putative ABC transport system substrate-binding protein